MSLGDSWQLSSSVDCSPDFILKVTDMHWFSCQWLILLQWFNWINLQWHQLSKSVFWLVQGDVCQLLFQWQPLGGSRQTKLLNARCNHFCLVCSEGRANHVWRILLFCYEKYINNDTKVNNLKKQTTRTLTLVGSSNNNNNNNSKTVILWKRRYIITVIIITSISTKWS